MNEEKQLLLEILYGGLREDIGIETYLLGPMDYAKKLKLRFLVGNLDPPERRNRYTGSRDEEDMDAHTICARVAQQ